MPVIVGGIIPPEDAQALRQAGAAVYTPKDYDLNAILEEIVAIVEGAEAGLASSGSVSFRNLMC